MSIETVVTGLLASLAPLVEVADPAIGGILTLVETVANKAIALEPDAVALFDQIKNGTGVTAAQMKAIQDPAYDAASAQLDADIAKGQG